MSLFSRSTMSVVSKGDPELGRLAENMTQPGVADINISASGLELTFSAALDDAENLEQLGPVIKQITETGRQEAFVDQLDALIRKKDGEIERMCNAHYQVLGLLVYVQEGEPPVYILLYLGRNSCKPSISFLKYAKAQSSYARSWPMLILLCKQEATNLLKKYTESYHNLQRA